MMRVTGHYRLGVFVIILMTGLCVLLGVAFAEFYLPSSLQEIADEAYYNCDSLTELEIPDGTTRIGARAFADCDNLRQITIPKSVTEIGEDAFDGCPSLLLGKLAMRRFTSALILQTGAIDWYFHRV